MFNITNRLQCLKHTSLLTICFHRSFIFLLSSTTHPLSGCSSGSALWGCERAADSPQLQGGAEEMTCYSGIRTQKRSHLFFTSHTLSLTQPHRNHTATLVCNQQYRWTFLPSVNTALYPNKTLTSINLQSFQTNQKHTNTK